MIEPPDKGEDEVGNALQKNRHPVLVVCTGAPRSGLNLLSQSLQMLGFSVPDEATPGPALIHALLCRDLGILSLTAGSLPRGWRDTRAAQIAEQRIRDLLIRYIKANESWVLADSFLARAFPLWQDVFAELNISPRLFILLRHPWEVASSLAAAENLDLTRAHILWLSHLRDALSFANAKNCVRITFDQLLTDPVFYLHSALGICTSSAASKYMAPDSDALLLRHVQSGLKHHHAGSISEAERKRFAAFIRIYDKQRCNMAMSAKVTEKFVQDRIDISIHEGLLEVMLQELGRWEVKEYARYAERNRFLHDSHREQHLFATVYIPMEKDKCIERHFLLFPDQWQRLTLDIPRPDLLKDMPLRLSPLNVTGIAALSTIEFRDKTTSKRVASIPAHDDGRQLTLKGTIVSMPSQDSLVFYVTGKAAEVLVSGVRHLSDQPMEVDIWIKATPDPAVYNEALRAFLSRENWQAVLGTGPKKTDSDSLLHLSDAFKHAGCLAEADAVLQKGLEMHPISKSLLIASAELAMQRQSWAEAIRRWQAVVAITGRHTRDYIYQQLDSAYKNQNLFPSGSPEEEAHMGDADKYEVLSLVHKLIEPELYLEIGVQEGKSLELADCPAIGIDPMPRVRVPLSQKTQIMAMTSDNFFSGPAADFFNTPPDLVFIDGMHFFEYALRDFMNVEKFSAAWTLVMIDDIFPAHPAQAQRDRKTRTWTGDVWKLYSVLKKYRPDLFFLPINTSPTGLLLIAGLKRENTVLPENYDQIVEQYTVDLVPCTGILTREGVFMSTHTIIPTVLKVLKNARKLGLSVEAMISELEEKVSRIGN